MANNFSVIVFTEDNTVEAVPTSWVKKKDGTCAWPTTKSRSLIMKLIEKKSVPNEVQYKYYKAKVMKTCESLTNARKMAEKGETKTDISSTDESDYMKLYKKKKPKLLLDCSDPSTSCPVYSASDDDSDKGNLTKSNQHKLVNGWSPSPNKMKLTCQSDPQGVKFHVNKKKSAVVRKISYSDSNRNENIDSSLLKNNENKSVQPLNIELVELDRLLSNDDDITDYCNDYITIDAVDGDTFIQNSKAAAVTSVTPSDKQSSAKQFITPSTHEKQKLDLGTSPINPDTEFQKEVLYRLSFIKHELRRIVSNQMELSQRMDNLESQNLSNIILHTNNNENNTYLKNDIPGLPMNTISDLNAFNQKLSEDEIFCNNVINQLTYIGGKHAKAMIKRIMDKLFTNELLQLFSYSGKKGKTKFSDQMICPIIFDAVKKQSKFKNVTQNEMEEVVKYVLAQAPFNIKRQLKK
ncbi:uncharacterized protein LOC114120255 [Aphis gossypii]|uniref:uncharacterized protein LOC114120255 n=1 Tax=Aphis gossypii TaxID=80765 RepID=UPI0021592BED|nr:uncharacterized protein LOC114120255 [Aphis gossypii]